MKGRGHGLLSVPYSPPLSPSPGTVISSLLLGPENIHFPEKRGCLAGRKPGMIPQAPKL